MNSVRTVLVSDPELTVVYLNESLDCASEFFVVMSSKFSNANEVDILHGRRFLAKSDIIVVSGTFDRAWIFSITRPVTNASITKLNKPISAFLNISIFAECYKRILWSCCNVKNPTS